MRKRLFACLLTVIIAFSCVGCTGYFFRISNGDYKEINFISLKVNGEVYSFGRRTADSSIVVNPNYELFPQGTNPDPNFNTIVNTIRKTFASGKIDFSHLFDEVEMSHNDLYVSHDKKNADIWFEISILDGTYEKLFFTMDLRETQTLWVYSTTTSSYNDGNFMEYYNCDCRELIKLVQSYGSRKDS